MSRKSLGRSGTRARGIGTIGNTSPVEKGPTTTGCRAMIVTKVSRFGWVADKAGVTASNPNAA
ncbi:MAG TPA: hypothetical protein DDZ51_26765 [Planctomycetaceae bacterium]|nr:hypothetical protein [Planctomycetaceae bacterium]